MSDYEITRDGFGVPTVRADSDLAAWRGLGFAAGRDRLWQLDYDRRRARGTMAELVGASALAADRLARRLRLGDAAAADLAVMDAATRAAFDAYATGVTEAAALGLPAEFDATGTGFAPWTAADSVAAFKIRHVAMGVWQYKIARATLAGRLGAEVAESFDPHPLPGMRVTVPPSGRIAPDDPRFAVLRAAHDDIVAAAHRLGFLAEVEAGSNAWVLAGSRTASGLPLLANDSHRALDRPTVYWPAQVVCPRFRVAGGTFPGIPGFPHFGHNGRVGWAITNASADAQDLYVEQFDGDRVRIAAGWADADVRAETIEVRGGDPVVERCFTTPNGPVVHGDPASGWALSMRWAATDEPCAQFGVLSAMLDATDVPSLLAAQRDWVDPVNNLVAADVDGHIGYLLRGSLPRRRSVVAAVLPPAGWDTAHGWDGRVPAEQMPTLLDPPEGLIVTCNNTITAGDVPYVSHAVNDGYRVERVHELAASGARFTAEDMRAWQGDVTSVAARTWVRELAARGPYDGTAESARRLIADADGELRGDSPAPLVHACFRRVVLERLLSDEVGPADAEWLLTSTLPGMPVLLRRWFARLAWPGADGTTAAARLDDALVRECLAAAWAEAPPGEWAAVHTTAAQHPLAPLVGDRWDAPHVGVGGDNETIQNSAYGWRRGAGFAITNLSVYRQVIDLAEPGIVRWIVPGGTSGSPGDAHTDDQLPLWQRHELAESVLPSGADG